MKVLMLPRNIGSEMNYRAAALRRLGVEVKAFSFDQPAITTGEHINTLPGVVNEFNPFKRLYNIYRYRKLLVDLLNWADIVHWSYDLTYIPLTNISIEKDLLLKYRKPGLIEWYGSDIRSYVIDSEINPYFKQVYEAGDWGYAEDPVKSRRNQKHFAELGWIPMEFISMGHYIDRKLFPKSYITHLMIGAQDLVPKFPDRNNKIPWIMHAPSHRGTKGSKYIIAALEELQNKHAIKFTLIENLKRFDCLELISQCDVFIDQIIIGSYGAAATEAMALGKPVVCYLNPIISAGYSPELPIWSANPDDITQRLEELIINPVLRHELGIKSRAYVDSIHNDDKNAKDQLRIYEEIRNEFNSRQSSV